MVRQCSLLVLVICCIHIYTCVARLEINSMVLASNLQKISDEGLGYTKIHLAKSVGNSFAEYSNAVKKLHKQLVKETTNLTSTTDSKIKECCNINATDALGGWCLRKADPKSTGSLLSTEFLEIMKENGRMIPRIGWQYYGNEEGEWTVHPESLNNDCSEYDPRLRPWYAEASAPLPKDIIIAVESPIGETNPLIKQAINILLDTINPNDRITVIKFGSEVIVYLGSSDQSTCFSQYLALATPQNTNIFRRFIFKEARVSKGSVKYLPVIQKAFEYFKRAADPTTKRSKLLVFLTASNPTDVKKPADFFQEVADRNKQLNSEVVIQTYAFGSKITNTTRWILSHMAQNTTYTTSTGKSQKGTFTHIEDDNHIRLQLHSYYSIFADSKVSEPVVTVPYFDFGGLGLVVSLCMPINTEGKLHGVTCVDAELEDIFFNVTYYHEGIDTYTFIIDKHGRTILHPKLPRPTAPQEDPKFVDILSLEMDEGMDEVVSSMRKGENGTKRLHTKREDPHLGPFSASPVYRDLIAEYYWTKVPDSDYSVCLVFTNQDRKVEMKLKNKNKFKRQVNYLHPNNLIQDNQDLQMCGHNGQLANIDNSVVMFSGSAYKFLTQGVDAKNATQQTSYVNFLKDEAYDQAPELKISTRSWVALSGLVDDIWGEYQEYNHMVLWRHLVTVSGVIRTYPGVNYIQYDPTVLSWYALAITHKGLLHLHPVFKGNSFNIMMSQAITENSHFQIPVAVLGGEFRPAVLKSLIEFAYPVCRNISYRCFLIDEEGIVLAHTLYTGKEYRPMHLITMEPVIAQKLIELGHLEESLCMDFLLDYRTLFNWKLALRGLFVESVSPSFELHTMPGTNAFIGITSSVDRSYSCNCMNFTKCSKYKDNSCRCPCYETLRFNLCNNTLPERENSGPPACLILKSTFDIIQPLQFMSPLKPCFYTRCSDIRTESVCYLQDGCQWCRTTPEASCLERSFCPIFIEPHKPNTNQILLVTFIVLLLIVVICVTLWCIWQKCPGILQSFRRQERHVEDLTHHQVEMVPYQVDLPSQPPIYDTVKGDPSQSQLFNISQDSGRASMDVTGEMRSRYSSLQESVPNANTLRPSHLMDNIPRVPRKPHPLPPTIAGDSMGTYYPKSMPLSGSSSGTEKSYSLEPEKNKSVSAAKSSETTPEVVSSPTPPPISPFSCSGIVLRSKPKPLPKPSSPQQEPQCASVNVETQTSTKETQTSTKESPGNATERDQFKNDSVRKRNDTAKHIYVNGEADMSTSRIDDSLSLSLSIFSHDPKSGLVVESEPIKPRSETRQSPGVQTYKNQDNLTMAMISAADNDQSRAGEDNMPCTLSVAANNVNYITSTITDSGIVSRESKRGSSQTYLKCP